MRKLGGVCMLGVWLVMAASASGADPTGGAVTGWRGDGTGQYPAADPPVQWQRVSTLTKGLRYSANEPKEGDAGVPMPDGVVREWLVLGPVPFPKENKIEKEAVPGEAALAPAAGQKTDFGAWKPAKLDSAYLDFVALLDKPGEAVAFACTHIYSETGGAFRLNLTSTGNTRVFVNGKACPGGGRIKVDLAKGWNRLLLKIAPGATGENVVWYAVPVFHAFAPATYEESGIAWHTLLPGVHGGFYGAGEGVSAPILLGDHIYMTSEPFDLVCLNKADGKLLWIRRASPFEAATDEEKKKTPEYKDAEAVAARLDAVNAAIVAGPATGKMFDEKAELEKGLQKAMKAVDPEKYALGYPPDIGWSGFTPASDGQRIYTWSSSGLVACLDLDGKLLWTRIARLPDVEHGLSSSPLLVDGKVVVFNRDLVAFDAKTGAPAWTTPIVAHEGPNPGQPHGTHVAASVGGVPIIAMANGCLFRASDGKKLFTAGAGLQSVASPVVEGGAVYQMTPGSTLYVLSLPAQFADPLQVQVRKIPVDISAFPKHYLPWHLCSPIIHEGLAYFVNNSGVFSVVDVAEGKVLYQKLLDLDVFQAHNEGAARGVGASLALAGKHIYVVGNNGATIVLEPGRTFKQVAKNKIENIVMVGHWAERQERFMANPVPDGKRLYLRGESGLYALGAK